jgi:hypothetical protein
MEILNTIVISKDREAKNNLGKPCGFERPKTLRIEYEEVKRKSKEQFGNEYPEMNDVCSECKQPYGKHLAYICPNEMHTV